MSFTVKKDKRYRAEISLSGFERFASNDTIRGKLLAAGFIQVIVAGSGKARTATGTWPHANTTAPVPSQITKLTEIA